MNDKILTLNEDEIKLLWNVINYRQSQVIHEQARQIQTISLLNDESKTKAIFDEWNKETVDEWMMLHEIKKRLK